MRTVAAVIGLGALAVLAGGCERKAPRVAAQKVAIPDCRSEDLALRRVSEEAGVGVVTYRFENRSAGSCALKGYASLALFGQDGHAVPAEVVDVPPPVTQQRAPKVVLRPGRRANFSVAYPTKTNGGCVSVVKLTATPPEADWGLDAPEARQLCGERKLSVSTFWYDSTGVM